MANKFRKLQPTLDLVGVKLTPGEVSFCIEYLKDLNESRASRAVGLHPDEGMKLLAQDNVKHALAHVFHRQLEVASIDVNWLLEQLVENHYLARDKDNINASNRALETIGKLASVDAFAAEKLDVVNATVAERLNRARRKLAEENDPDRLTLDDFDQ